MQEPKVSAQPHDVPYPNKFITGLVRFMTARQLPLDLNPMVGDRRVALITLHMAVVKYGGYKKVTQQNGWAQVAEGLQLHPTEKTAAQLKSHYEQNLLMFEEARQLSQARLNQEHQRAVMQNADLAAAQQEVTGQGHGQTQVEMHELPAQKGL